MVLLLALTALIASSFVIIFIFRCLLENSYKISRIRLQQKSYTILNNSAAILFYMATGMIIDGIFASQAIDSSGEILDVEGCDISTLDRDGVLNYEHLDGSSKESKAFGQEIVGKIVYARKVFSAADCETDRQKEYWEKVGKIPFIYGMCRLYDGAG